MLMLMLGMAVAVQAAGQTTEVQDAPLIARLVEHAATYRQTLPSLECDEEITSQQWKDGKLKKETRVRGSFRLVRQDSGKEPFVESHRYVEANGKVLAEGADVKMPVFTRGAFANGLAVFFDSPERAACLSFAVQSQTSGEVRVTVAKNPVVMTEACGHVTSGVTGLVIVERAGDHVTHLERSLPAEIAKARHQPMHSAIDYAPVNIGGESYWLPVKVDAEPGQDGLRFSVVYSNFHRYGATMKLLPATPATEQP